MELQIVCWDYSKESPYIVETLKGANFLLLLSLTEMDHQTITLLPDKSGDNSDTGLMNKFYSVLFKKPGKTPRSLSVPITSLKSSSSPIPTESTIDLNYSLVSIDKPSETIKPSLSAENLDTKLTLPETGELTPRRRWAKQYKINTTLEPDNASPISPRKTLLQMLHRKVSSHYFPEDSSKTEESSFRMFSSEQLQPKYKIDPKVFNDTKLINPAVICEVFPPTKDWFAYISYWHPHHFLLYFQKLRYILEIKVQIGRHPRSKLYSAYIQIIVLIGKLSGLIDHLSSGYERKSEQTALRTNPPDMDYRVFIC